MGVKVRGFRVSGYRVGFRGFLGVVLQGQGSVRVSGGPCIIRVLLSPCLSMIWF